ncbi:hypothetical protein BDZ89DRAFT_1080328 [Hymenopellis radicata]|nr:hypothetical protein BDZ89DRAFT_1080328 [Hymenopellis radicata]
MVMPLPWTRIRNLIIRPDKRASYVVECQWDKAVSAIKPRTEVRSLTIACLDPSEVTFPTLFNLVPSPPQFRFTCLIVAPEAWTPTLLALLVQASVPELLELIMVSNSPATVAWPLTVPTQVSEVVDALASFVRNSTSQLQNLTVTDVHIPTERSEHQNWALKSSSTSTRAWNILPLLEAAPSLLRLTLTELQSHLITPELIQRLKDSSFLSYLSELELGWAPRAVRCSYSFTHSKDSTPSTPNDPNESLTHAQYNLLSTTSPQGARQRSLAFAILASRQWVPSRDLDDSLHDQTESSGSSSSLPHSQGLDHYTKGPGQLYEDLCQESFAEILPLRATSGLSTVVLNTRDEDWASPVFKNLVHDLRQRGVRASLA